MVKKRNLKKKKKMSIGTHGKYTSGNNKYNVHWGTTGVAYNRNRKSFTKRTPATKFKNKLVKKYKKLGYAVDYIYIAD